MTPVRLKMITAMHMRGFSPRTHQSYLAAVKDLARYTRRSPDVFERSDIQAYYEHLVLERHLSAASCRVHLHGIRFLYEQVLDWDAVEVGVAIPRLPQRIPDLLTRAKRRASIDKVGGIHRLRHAYATHQLAVGLLVHRLQHVRGH